MLSFVLMLSLSIAFGGAGERVRPSVLALGALELGLLCGALATLWLPAVAAEWQRALPRELRRGVALAVSI